MTTESQGRKSLSPTPGLLLHADGDNDWAYYVEGHDPDELHQVDDLDALLWERVWMRPIKASQCGYGVVDWDPNDRVLRNPATGRFEPRWYWIECPENDPQARPFIAARYKPW